MKENSKTQGESAYYSALFFSYEIFKKAVKCVLITAFLYFAYKGFMAWR